MREQSFILRKGIRSFASLMGFLSSLPTDKEFKVTIGEVKRERSNAQNNALFGVAYKVLGEFTGYTAPELHEMFLRSYFGETETNVLGKVIVKPRRTTTTDETGKRNVLSTVEFMNFYAHIQQKGAEIGCYVPDPDPMYWMREEREQVAA